MRNRKRRTPPPAPPQMRESAEFGEGSKALAPTPHELAPDEWTLLANLTRAIPEKALIEILKISPSPLLIQIMNSAPIMGNRLEVPKLTARLDAIEKKLGATPPLKGEGN